LWGDVYVISVLYLLVGGAFMVDFFVLWSWFSVSSCSIFYLVSLLVAMMRFVEVVL